MLIGELAKKSGLSRDTIRYYEKLSLLVVHDRPFDNPYKDYGPAALQRLQQIQQLKSVGFSLSEIGQLLVDAQAAQPCQDLPQQLAQKIARVEQQIATLQQYKTALQHMQRCCDGACAAPGGLPACVPLQTVGRAANKCC